MRRNCYVHDWWTGVVEAVLGVIVSVWLLCVVGKLDANRALCRGWLKKSPPMALVYFFSFPRSFVWAAMHKGVSDALRAILIMANHPNVAVGL